MVLHKTDSLKQNVKELVELLKRSEVHENRTELEYAAAHQNRL